MALNISFYLLSLNTLISTYFIIIYYFRILGYATTHTEDSVYIIGGYTDGSPKRTSTIAKYKNDIWTIAGNLKQARNSHGAITVKGRTIIIGGYPNRGST